MLRARVARRLLRHGPLVPRRPVGRHMRLARAAVRRVDGRVCCDVQPGRHRAGHSGLGERRSGGLLRCADSGHQLERDERCRGPSCDQARRARQRRAGQRRARNGQCVAGLRVCRADDDHAGTGRDPVGERDHGRLDVRQRLPLLDDQRAPVRHADGRPARHVRHELRELVRQFHERQPHDGLLVHRLWRLRRLWPSDGSASPRRCRCGGRQRDGNVAHVCGRRRHGPHPHRRRYCGDGRGLHDQRPCGRAHHQHYEHHAGLPHRAPRASRLRPAQHLLHSSVGDRLGERLAQRHAVGQHHCDAQRDASGLVHARCFPPQRGLRLPLRAEP